METITIKTSDNQPDVISQFNQITSEFLTARNLPIITTYLPEESADDGSLAWLAANLEQLSKKHGDKWVLIKACEVIEESDDPNLLAQTAERLGIASPYITKIPAPSTTWRTAYGDGTTVR